MSFKEKFEQERRELQSIKRPYESVAFLLFGLLVLQQLFWLFKNLIDFLDPNQTWFSTGGIITAGNNMGFITRIYSVDNSKWIWVILGTLAYFGYYFLIYLLVWNYCKKNDLAKWTWTLFVVFGPGIILIPSYVFFVAYAFRPYLVRFFKKMYVEFTEFDPNQQFPEEIEPVFNEDDYNNFLTDEEPVENTEENE